MDTGNIDGGGFFVIERDLEDAVGLGGVADLGTIGLDRDYMEGEVFDGIIYLDEAEGMSYRILVEENQFFTLL